MLVLLSVLTSSLAGGVVIAADTPPAAAPPDFSDVDDVLLGRRLILPVQDLVAAAPGDTQITVLQTDQGKITNQAGSLTDGTIAYSASGRIFDLPNDVIVTLMTFSFSAGTSLDVLDPAIGDTLHNPQSLGTCTPAADCNPNLLALGDLTGDGYDEVVIGYAGGGIQVGTAVDVSDFSQGLRFGEPFGAGTPFPRVVAMAVGDLNGDGTGELATVEEDLFRIYNLEPTPEGEESSLTLEIVASTIFDPFTVEDSVFVLQIGQFDSEVADRELLLAFQDQTNGWVATTVQVDTNLQPTIAEPEPIGAPTLGIAVARFDWLSDIDQVVLVVQNGPELILSVNNFEENALEFLSAYVLTPSSLSCDVSPAQAGLAVGDYTFDVDDPGTALPALSIANLLWCPDAGTGAVQLFSVDPTNQFAITPLGPNVGLTVFAPGTPTGLLASDTQGRSLLLAQPAKVVINQHSQPRIVMGAPPMHIDYVQDPINSSTGFGQVNMTAYPSNDQSSVRGMNSEFDLASSSTVQSQSTNTMSYTYSVSHGEGGGLNLNIPDIASIGASVKYAASTTYAGMVQNQFGDYFSNSFNISTITGFGDVVWYDTNRFNLWIYRVIGHFACPADDTDCDSGLPLYLTLSGPDQILPHPHTPGTAVEWYQPFHEVGNILSYPQNLTQLQQALDPDTDFSSIFDLPFTTGSADDTETVQWSTGQSSSQSSGSVLTHGYSMTETVSAAISFLGGGGASFSESSSNSIGTLNTNVQTMAASNGFKVTVPGFNFGETYSYPFVGYLLGLAEDPDILQTELQEELAGEVDQPVNGTLRLAFTAQPDLAQGDWWTATVAPYLSAPDVALNHPLRWSLLSESSGPLSSIYCFNLLDRTEIQKAGSYEMKGLFILPQGATTGPQQTIATEGDVLQLEARVYNYSRLDMAAGTQVKAQFYGQEWDSATQGFTGDAFLIGEDTLPPIQGNNSGNLGLNASFANVEFNTASCPIAGGCANK
ncbi:MAG: hypothetical protein AB7X49_25820, partial [Geminicoccaceae bacterium]